jgi:hypothetical protein
MDIALWLMKLVVGTIIGAVVTLAVSEPLKEWLAPFVANLGSKKEDGVSGRWQAIFFYGPNEDTYVEVIEVSNLFGAVVGRIVPHPSNHPAAKKVEMKRPLRVRGAVKDNRFFTGVWLHPDRHSHHHGAFDLIIKTDNELMDGYWLGYSESKNVIESGRWYWKRMDV